jgi:outer membrane lipoprotein-sorting protein
MQRRLFPVAVLLLFAAPFTVADEKKPPAELTDPVEVLKKMDAAIKAVESVAYDIEFEPTGDAVKFLPKGKGTVILSGWSEGRPKMFRVDTDAVMPQATASTRLTAGADGENYYLIDHANKKVYEDIDPGVMGKGGQVAFSAVMPEFVHPTPFEDEIEKSEKQTMKDAAKLGDHDCYVVFVEYKGGQRKSSWYISKQDFLPRRRVDHWDMPGTAVGDLRKTITKLVIDPKLEPDAFKCKLPAGFEKIDDFAP